MLFYLIILAYQNVKKFLKLAEIKSSNISPLIYRKYLIILCYRRFTALSKSQRLKMQRAEEIDVTDVNLNEEPTDQSGFSLMNKRSEIKSPIPSRTEIFPSLCLFFNKSSQ